ncbi:TspO/MBR family protein [Sphingomonas sp. RB3P16]|uniref:TspO/MBR family protein n=1 Tax=Parasphingomonas frigoris TaxID=3096163 RepID=UPI002FC91433
MHRSWGLPIAVAAAAALAVVVMGMTITEVGPWYAGLIKPHWAPPDAVYAVAWTAIYLCTALSAVTGWRAMPDRYGTDWMIGLFALSGFLNIVWSLLFFHFHRPDWAAIAAVAWWVSVGVWIYVVWPRSSGAGALLLPYLGWVTFAGYLTMTIARLNGPFG